MRMRRADERNENKSARVSSNPREVEVNESDGGGSLGNNKNCRGKLYDPFYDDDDPFYEDGVGLSNLNSAPVIENSSESTARRRAKSTSNQRIGKQNRKYGHKIAFRYATDSNLTVNLAIS